MSVWDELMNVRDLVKQIESRPCACGRRETSEPQILLSESREVRGGECVVRMKLRCGVCQTEHKAACSQYVTPEAMECL